jgi:hypothetical protein
VVDNEVDNVRRQAAATLLEQAAVLVRAGAVAEVDALLCGARDLLRAELRANEHGGLELHASGRSR